MTPTIPGYRLGASLEPPHPNCTISDPVYAAVAGGQTRAVKILNLGFPLRDESRRRFLEVASAARRITAPAVIRVVDAGFCDDGRPFYAMEHVLGETLEARMNRKAIASARETRAILVDVANGVKAAAEVGLASSIQARHVVMTSSGARIWNLGIHAWRTWAEELVAGTYTNGGQYIRHANLTPHEANGLARTAANVSAQLALVSFALLAGRPYWDADLDMTTPPMVMLMEVMANAGPLPSARTSVALPDGFDAWFARCVAGQVADPSDAVRSFPAPDRTT
jgi:eukaryotic-like serine/threonine-protein kinase